MRVATPSSRKNTRGGDRRSLALAGAVLAAATATANVFAVGFHVALARLLDPGEYSLLASLLAVALVLAVPTLALQPAVARVVARSLARGDERTAGMALRSTLRGLALVGSGAVALGAAVSLPLAQLVRIEDPLPVVATLLTVLASAVVPATWGALQGQQRFLALGLSQVAIAGLRLSVGVAIAAAGGGAGAVMLGIAGATFATFLLSALPLRSLLASGGGSIPVRRLARGYGVGAAAGLTLFAALTTADLLAARLAFDQNVAGSYAAASVGGRFLLLVPVAVTTVLFPRVATFDDPLRERRYLLAGLAAVTATSLVAIAALALAPGLLLRLGFGEGYEDAQPWIAPLAVAMAFYALVNVYLFHFLSLGRLTIVAALGLLFPAQVAALAVFHGRPAELIGVQLACAAVALAACEILDWRGRR